MSRAMLPLCLALCLFAAVNGNRLSARQLLQVPDDPTHLPPANQTCYYDPSGILAPWLGKCAINPVWFAAQKTHSKGARADVLQAKYDLACGRHLPATFIGKAVTDLQNGVPLPANLTAAFAACNNDTANYCYVDLDVAQAANESNAQCRAFTSAGVVVANLACPGSPYAAFIDCFSRNQANCTGACAWNTQVFNASGDGILNTPEFSRVARLLEGPVLQRGYSCVPKEAQNLAGQDLQDYFSSMGKAAARGNCTYAVGALERARYGNVCNAFNNATDFSNGIMQGYIDYDSGEERFDGINATLAAGCLAAGCEVARIAAGNFGFNTDVFYCNAYRYKVKAMHYYDSYRDIVLLRALRQCAQPEKQYNQTACESTVLTAY